MDFPGGTITNIRAIDGFTTIYWRIYTEEPVITSLPPEAAANGHIILKHLSRLKDLELRLRNLDCLASCYPRRLGLWVFSATPNFESLSPLYPNGDDSCRLLVDSTTLKVLASGSIASVDLVRNLSAEPQQTSNVNHMESQKPQNGPRRMDSYNSSAAIYASFISAVTGAINLQFVRRHNAIPLGSRTLFTAVERDGYESPRIDIDDPASVPSLITLQIQLTPVGKLIVSLQTIAQTALTQLCGPSDSVAEVLDIQPGIDLWLSPNGTTARLVTANIDRPSFPSPGSLSGRGGAQDSSSSMFAAKRRQWKLDVREWLGRFGLSIDSIDEEIWVEVEVCEPFYAKLAGETRRQNEERLPGLPLKRLLWPARYCFRRAESTLSASSYGPRDFSPSVDDPLEFAERWYVTASSRYDEPGPKTSSYPRHQQPKGQGMSFLRTDLPEGIESLSRIAQYPDLQTASLVYPTPPDGAATIRLNYRSSLDTFGEDSGLGLSQVGNRNGQKPAQEVSFPKDPFDPSLTMDFGPSAGLTVGSGRYDTNDDDDDLFGEMNDKDFGSKGITDADFSFFDDPGFGVMENGTGAGGIQETTQNAIELLEDAPVPSPFDEKMPKDNPECDSAAPPIKLDVGEPSRLSPVGNTTNVCEERVPIDTAPLPCDANSQPVSPPLSPIEVKRILFPAADQSDHDPAKGVRRQSHYTPVTFKQDLSEWNRKYGADGRFWFANAAAPTTPNDNSSMNGIPTIGLPRRRGKVRKLVGTPLESANDNGTRSSGMKLRLRSTSFSSDDTSDDSDETASALDSSSAILRTLKRKRALSDTGDSLVSSPEKLSIIPDQDSTPHKAENSVFLGNFVSVFSDWSLAGYFSISQSQLPPVLPRREEQVQIAQLLVDQITQSSLKHRLDGQLGLSDFEKESFSLRTFLEDTIFMGEIERLDLKDYVSLQDSYLSLPARDGIATHQITRRKDAVKGSMSKLSPPHLRIRRGKDYLEVLPPAISFWETFGLEPADGPKDISAYCIHPHIAAEAADVFLKRFGLLYSSCGLGKHTRGEKSKMFERGLGSWNMNPSDASGYSSVMRSLKALCEGLAVALLKGQPTKDSIVVYIINPFTHAAALADICSAFWQLFQKFVNGVDRQQARQLSELVLQIIPLDFITSADSISVPTQTEYLNLALEVYSRCAPRNSSSNLLNYAPPVLLTEPVPKAINFKLASERISPLREGKSLHLAYSRSLDRRWITVAWSDNTGSFQRTASYCLRFRGSSVAQSISDVRNEIWVTTRSIMEKIQARWRVLLVNTEPVDQEEVDAWTSLAEQHNKTQPVPFELIILSVNITPDLYLEPPLPPMPVNIFTQISPTPVATPNPSAATPSPDQFGNVPSPASGTTAGMYPSTPTDIPLETDSESLLIDICDESWGVVLSHRLNNSPHSTEYRPALVSGYLLRRKGPTDGDGVLAMNVNLIYTQRPPSSYDILLKETLGMYRGLASLARAKGTHHVQRNTLPWHIATAARGQEVLSYVL